MYGTGIAMVINRGPQLIELVRYRGATGVSVVMWLLGATAGVGWVIYYQNEQLWAPMTSTACAGAVSFIIALLAAWRHRQVRATELRSGVAVATGVNEGPTCVDQRSASCPLRIPIANRYGASALQRARKKNERVIGCERHVNFLDLMEKVVFSRGYFFLILARLIVVTLDARSP